MKKMHLMITAAIVVIGFTACKDSAADQAKEDVNSLSQYVDSVENLSPVYTTENWTVIDNGYQERALKAEATVAALKEEDKARIDASKAKYATLKANYEVKIKEKDVVVSTPDYRQVLRNRLFGEGKIGADMSFSFITADNILSVYKNFVNTVSDNKNEYTREDWDEIKVLYEALDNRKNAVEKDLATNDNLKIAGLKVKFASIKATHRVTAKAEENQKAKQ